MQAAVRRVLVVHAGGRRRVGAGARRGEPHLAARSARPPREPAPAGHDCATGGRRLPAEECERLPGCVFLPSVEQRFYGT